MSRHMVVATVVLAVACGVHGQERDKVDLDVLYVGNAGTERAEAFVEFLTERFTEVRAAAREGFDPRSAAGADVVLLDWAQTDIDFRNGGFRGLASPLGDRDAWRTPTVLLDSAGLLIASPWQTAGSYG